jgi:hypothetical protein
MPALQSPTPQSPAHTKITKKPAAKTQVPLPPVHDPVVRTDQVVQDHTDPVVRDNKNADPITTNTGEGQP